MTPGPTLVYKCPDTGKPIFLGSIGSGNTFGATFWTDGHMDSPMLPENPPFLISPHTGRLLWIEDLVYLDSVDFYYARRDPQREYPDGKWPVDEPGLDQLWDYLNSKVALTRQREVTIRLYAWRRSNDPARQAPPTDPIRTSRAISNMERLVEILAPRRNPDCLLSRAELLRELGRFEECLKPLCEIRSPQRESARQRIKSLALLRDSSVRPAGCQTMPELDTHNTN